MRHGCARLVLLVAGLGCVLAAGLVGCTTESEYVLPSVTNPASLTVTAGQTASFSVVAHGYGTLQYQWMMDGVAIPGATGSAWTTAATRSTDDGEQFSVRVSNGYGTATSAAATLTVVTPAGDYPVITQQPLSVSACANSTVTLSVAATNATGYQWLLNGTPIAGATGPMYVIGNATAAADGMYAVVVSNSLASVTSQAVTVTVGSTITTNPANVTLDAGQVGTFTVAATGEAPFAYQWYRLAPGGTNVAVIAGANAATYVTPVAQSTDNGAQFYATVTDACGTAYTSKAATLTVNVGDVPPTIVQQPASVSVAPGTTPTFTALAVGTPTITYQWYRITAGSSTGTAVSGATGVSFTLPGSATAIANNGDEYYVIATNAYGQAVSQNATLVIGNVGLLIVQQPVSQYVQVGQTATFTVVAQSTSVMTYQWYEAAPGSGTFAAIAGATSASYSVTNATLSEYGSVFYVVVSNGTTSVTSSIAGLFVGALNQIGGFCDSEWTPHGSTVELASNGSCSFQMTDAGAQAGTLVWPELIATGNLQMSFTITMSNPSAYPADGFTVMLADPSQGATVNSLGGDGGGLGAKGIPGFVLGFDTYQDGPPDAPIVPYVGVTRGSTALFENPWFNINDNIAPIVAPGQVIATNFAITLVDGQMTVTQNGNLIFSGAVSVVPPVAYLFVTAATGASYETVVISNFSGVVGNP